MDKEWLSKSRLSHEYEDGVESFLQFAKQNAVNPDVIPCPCIKCGNMMMLCNIVILWFHVAGCAMATTSPNIS